MTTAPRRVAKALLGRRMAARRQRPDQLHRLVDEYETGSLLLEGGRVPLGGG